MNNTSRILELATQITKNTTIVNDYLRTNDLPQPSFSIDGPTDLTFKSSGAEQARLDSIGASMELQDLLQGPIACLRPAINATSLEAIYRYDIPSKVPINGSEISFQTLAKACNMYEPNLRRILRYAILYHRVFHEPRPGYITHSAASKLLVMDSEMFDTLGMMYDESWQAFARTCDAMQKFNSQEPHETGYSLAHSPSNTVWSYYASHPTRAKRFASAMKSLTSNQGQSPQHLTTGYPWSSLAEGSKVIDMGGSEGHVSIAIAQVHKHLTFVVQDLPEIVEGVVLGDEVEEGIRKKIRFMGHDFFTEQTVEGEIFLFRWIFHDWPDEYVLKILRNLTPVMREGDKVVVNDQVMPGPGEMDAVVERQIRLLDLTMLSFFNSREREKGDWEGLFREADERFGNVKVWTPKGSSFAIIEATWMPNRTLSSA